MSYAGESFTEKTEKYSMGKNIFLPAAVIAAAMLTLTAVMHVTKLNASPTLPVNTQNYTPSRYAIAAAEINVAVLQSSGSSNVRKVLVRLDSVTGKLHILQMSVRGDNNPQVLSAVWTSASESGSFQPFGGENQENF